MPVAKFHTSSASLPGKRTWYPLDGTLGGPQIRSWRSGEEKVPALLGIYSRSSSLWPSHFTDWGRERVGILEDKKGAFDKRRVYKQWYVFLHSMLCTGSRDSSVGTALGYQLDDRSSRFRFPVGAGNFSLHHRIHNGSGAHPASYPMVTRGSFPGG
jgi:hypothetical protein